MSFCQKHQNHHCVHAHNCGSHKHKICKNTLNRNAKNIKNDPNADIFNRSSKKLQKITEQNQQAQCHFKDNSNSRSKRLKCNQCEYKQNQIDKQNAQLTSIRKQHSETQKKCSKLFQQNRELQGVVEYYRLEMDRIIKCGESDIKNQIKRHMKENTQLSAKNKFLLHKLNEVEQLVDKLAKQNEQLHKKIASFRKQKEQLITTYESLVQKLRKNYHNDSSKENDISMERKKNNELEIKYKIIIEEIKKIYDQISKQSRKLNSQNKEICHQIQVLKSKLSNNQKLHKMQQQSLQEREIVLKKKLQASEKQIKDLKQFITKLQNALKLKDQQVSYSKKVIQKQMRLIKQNKDLYEEVNKNIEESSKQNRERMQQQEDRISAKLKKDAQSSSKQNMNDHYKRKDDRFGSDRKNQEVYITSLKDQIITLKDRIAFLESQSKGGIHSNQTIQQYILTIGASEAFKRIIQQKNEYIKKLIRQKGVLYQKL